ncbi:MAG: aminoglycoside phosphotransferase family protein [Kiritimatiellaeota bacterium]|nr:aminoglycoside phosphotransferase family protein [Kiritimatiellota bacterium]
MQDPVTEVFKHFHETGRVADSEQIIRGHINRTYLVTHEDTDGKLRKFILQKLNTTVFTRPHELMENVVRVSEHIRSKLRDDDKRGTIRFLRTLDGALALDSPELGFWRAYRYIDNAEGLLAPETEQDAFAAGVAFGRFQALLADLPKPRLHETIPHFHDTRRRFQRLEESAAQNPVGRLAECEREFDRIIALRPHALRVQEAAEAGIIPERITHNDAKISNVLLDTTDRHPVCVIDLDTCMPGLSHHDFGDLVRSICDSEPEDSATPEKTFVKLDAYRALHAGYAKETDAIFSDGEKALLPDAGITLTLELVARFLTDFLDGDKYFSIHEPKHNLRRARAQLVYGEKLIEALPQMRG